MTEQEKQQTKEIPNTVNIEDAGPCKKKVSIEVPAEKIKTAMDEQYEELRKDAQVPGFRKGRAPLRLLEKKFGKEVTEQVKLKLLADATDSAFKDLELDTLREPDIDHEQIELDSEQPMKVEFEVEVRPEFDLPELQGIPVEKETLEVTDEQVDRELEQMRKWSGTWAPVTDGVVEPQDQVIADVVLNVEGVEEEQKNPNSEIHIRPSGFVCGIPVDDLDQLLEGANVGDTKQTTVQVPKTFFKEEYRDKKVDISIDIKDIKRLTPAEMDEAFLGRFGVDDEDELKERIREHLENQLEQQVRAKMTEQIHKYLLEKTDFDLPLDIVADQARNLLVRQQVSLMQQGLSREEMEERTEQLKTTSEDQAKEQLKAFFIMDKVADKLEIDVTEEEINGHIAQIAMQQNQRPEKLREKLMRDGSLAQFRMQARENKCIAKLLESAKITEIAPKEPPKKKKAAKTKTANKTTKKTEKAAASDKKTAKKTKKKTKKKTDT